MNFTCNQCGANYKIENPDIFVICESCDNSLYIDIDEIMSVYTYEPQIESKQLSSYLERNFEKKGFDEEIEIIDTIPAYIPFWEIEGEKELERGSSLFPEEKIKKLSVPKKFVSNSDLEGGIETVEIDTQPENSKKIVLHYIPFFKTEISYKDKKFPFFINAINGEVEGDPIPYVPTERTRKLFPLFITIFLIFIINCSLFNNIVIIMPLNLIALYVFYQLSIHSIEKNIYNNED